MKPLFCDEGLKVLEAFCLSSPLVAFDYDGTLAPIVDDPSEAFLPERARTLIERIHNFAPIAVISGRKQDDVQSLLNMDFDFVIGNHGLEGLPGNSHSIESAKVACRGWDKQLQDLSKKNLGTWVENKEYSVAIHYRKSVDKKQAKSNILQCAANLEPTPRIVMGKCVVNLMLPGAPHKGVALLELMLHTEKKSAIYIGDDDNDEDVFCLAEENLLSIRIGKSETSAAMYYLESQDDVVLFLAKCEEFFVSRSKGGLKS